MPIWVGPYEAKMISLALEEIEAKRPLPHDLMKNILHELDAVVTKIVICNLEKDTYFELAVRDIRALPKLEGTVHVNMALIIKFMTLGCSMTEK